MISLLRSLMLFAALAGGGLAHAQIPTRTAPVAPAPPLVVAPRGIPTAPPQSAPITTTVPAPPSMGSVAPPGYKIGPEDVVDVGVLGQSEFATRARVQTDGTIKLPFLGVLKVTGDTALTLADKVSAQLKAGGYYAKPIVTVDIALFASNYIVVLGEVGTPGLQPVDRTYHLSEVIARAGGIREGGADYVVLTRRDGTPRNLPFDKLARGTEADDPIVQAGDKVFVPASELFYIYGQVNAPGVYGLRAGMTLRMALGRAGGIGLNGSEKRIKVYHDGTERKVGLDQPVQPGDVIVIGERLF